MRKKASVLGIFTLMLALIILFIFFLNQIQKYDNEIGEEIYIGKSQMDLFMLYPQAEIDSLFIRLMGGDLLKHSLYNLGEDGGFYGEGECGMIGNYNFWFNKTDDCIPDYKNYLNYHFSDSLDNYFRNIDEVTNVKISKEYNVFLKESDGTNVFASAMEPTIYERDSVKYAVRHSFSSYLDYQISNYDLLFEESKELRDICMNKIDYDQCVLDQLVHLEVLSDLDWSQDCNRGEEKIFYAFIENYKKCINSLGDGCACQFTLFFEDISLDGDYEILLTKDGKIQMGDLVDTVDINPALFSNDATNIQELDEIKIVVSYDQGKFKSTKLFLDPVNHINFNPIKIYKTPHTDYTVESDFVFVDSSVQDFCGIFTRTAKICALDKKAREIFFDKLELVKIPIKFAIYFNDIFPPSSVQGITVKDQKFAENGVVLNFTKNLEEDVYNYKIYYSDMSFNNVNSATYYDEILHNSFEDTVSIVINGLEDGKEYFFAVTAMDIFENEDKEVISVVGIPIDDVGPEKVMINTPKSGEMFIEYDSATDTSVLVSWDSPNLNENGQPLNDLLGYYVFKFDTLISELPQLKIDECVNNCYFIPSGQNEMSLDVSQGQNFIVVVAIDDEIQPNYVKELHAPTIDYQPFISEEGDLQVDVETVAIDTSGYVTSAVPISQKVFNQQTLISRFGHPDNVAIEYINFLGKKIGVHESLKNVFLDVQADILASGVNYNFKSIGGYNKRYIANTNIWSSHAFGLAVDINPQQNGYYKRTPGVDCKTDIPPEVIVAFKKHGFCWGGHFTRMCDAMHFEYCKP